VPIRGIFRGAMGAQPPPPIGKVEALIFRRVSAPNGGSAPPPSLFRSGQLAQYMFIVLCVWIFLLCMLYDIV